MGVGIFYSKSDRLNLFLGFQKSEDLSKICLFFLNVINVKLYKIGKYTLAKLNIDDQTDVYNQSVLCEKKYFFGGFSKVFAVNLSFCRPN